jgi:PAS domain S-box-containing protein
VAIRHKPCSRQPVAGNGANGCFGYRITFHIFGRGVETTRSFGGQRGPRTRHRPVDQLSRIMKAENTSPVSPSPGFEAYLLDQVQAAVIGTDLAGAITHWNRGAEVMFGWTLQEALGRDFRELFISSSEADLANEIFAAVMAGTGWEGELPLRGKDGKVVLAHSTLSPIRGPGGEVAGIVGVSVDITERVRKEKLFSARTSVTEALAEAASLTEAAPKILQAICGSLGWQVGALWRVDEAAGLLRCVDLWHVPSLKVAEFERASRGSLFRPGIGLPGRVWSSGRPAWIPDVVQDDNFPRAPSAAKEGLHGAFGFPVLLTGHVLGVLEFFSREIQEPDADLLQALSVIGSQIGQFMERKEAEEAVRESEARKSAIVEAALDCIITIDHEGKVTEFNPAAEKTFGYLRDDALGREMAELIIPPYLRDRHRAGLAHYLATGVGPLLGKRVELTAVRADGTEFPAEVTISRVDLPGPPVFTGYVRDITHRQQAEQRLRESRERLRLAVEAGRLGTWHYDIDAGTVTWDQILEGIFGLRLGAFGGTFEEYAERLHPDERDWILETVDHARESGSDFEIEHRVVWPDGSVHWIQGRGLCIKDFAGRVVAMSGVAADITARKRIEQAERFLSEAGPLLAASIGDFEETLGRVAHLVVPEMADWCSIDMLQPDGSIRQVVVAHVDPEKVKLAREFRDRYPPDPSAPAGVPRVLRTGQPEMLSDIPDALLEESAPDPGFLHILRGLGLRSVLIVPMVARGRTLGAMTLVAAESGRRYDQTDLAFAQEVARRAALAVDNAHLVQELRRVATQLQESLLPPTLPDIDGMEIEGRYRWGGQGNEVGGDFYDAFETGDGSWALTIGDVCGKGVEAAVVTSLARHTLRAVALQERKPSAILEHLNQAVMQQRTDHMFCTVCYVRLKPDEGGARLTVCAAGHPLPLVLRADGSVETAGVPGALLGIFPDPELTDSVVDLCPGDALVLFTDGVLEERRKNGEIFGRERLASILASCSGKNARAIAEAIESAVVGFAPEAPRDDVALLVVRVKGASTSRRQQ